jgi:hypothetical protein
MSHIRFIIKNVKLSPSYDFNDDGYKIYGKIRDLYNEREQFEIDDILEFLTFDRLKESFIKSFTNPYNYLFKHILFDYKSHVDRKKKPIKNANNFNTGEYYFYFLSDPLEVTNEDEDVITVVFEGLNRSFNIKDLELNFVKIDSIPNV